MNVKETEFFTYIWKYTVALKIASSNKDSYFFFFHIFSTSTHQVSLWDFLFVLSWNLWHRLWYHLLKSGFARRLSSVKLVIRIDDHIPNHAHQEDDEKHQYAQENFRSMTPTLEISNPNTT